MTSPARLLQTAVPAATSATWGGPLDRAAGAFPVGDEQHTAWWLANLLHESGAMQRLEESLWYSPERLTEVWPSRFPTIDAAAPYAANPEKLAEKVYGGRMGNGPEGSGDGYAFRGRGLIMLTGRANYEQAAAATGLPLVDFPALLLEPDPAATVAAWYWRSRGLHRADTFLQTVKGINGGINGLPDREAWLAKIEAGLEKATPAPAPAPAASGYDRVQLRGIDRWEFVSLAISGLFGNDTSLTGPFAATVLTEPDGSRTLQLERTRP